MIRVLHSFEAEKATKEAKLRSILIMYMRELGWQLLTAFQLKLSNVSNETIIYGKRIQWRPLG